MRVRLMSVAAIAAYLATTGLALAQTAAPDAAPSHDHSGAPAANPAASESADPAVRWTEINERMHTDMAIAYSGDANADFVRAMIPHHQGAVDMARFLLEHGDDAELRALAENIITSQEEEIAMMRAWLEENHPDPAK